MLIYKYCHDKTKTNLKTKSEKTMDLNFEQHGNDSVLINIYDTFFRP